MISAPELPIDQSTLGYFILKYFIIFVVRETHLFLEVLKESNFIMQLFIPRVLAKENTLHLEGQLYGIVGYTFIFWKVLQMADFIMQLFEPRALAIVSSQHI